MKSLEEYKKEIEQDPKARRRLKKLEKEFQKVEDSLTEEELIKYGLMPEKPEGAERLEGSEAPEAPGHAEIGKPSDPEVDSILDVLSHRI